MPENYTAKRQDLAVEAAQNAKAIMDAIWRLAQIKLTVAESGGGFDDADCTGTLAYLNAWKLNNLVNTVGPALATAVAGHLDPNDAGSATLESILLAVRP